MPGEVKRVLEEAREAANAGAVGEGLPASKIAPYTYTPNTYLVHNADVFGVGTLVLKMLLSKFQSDALFESIIDMYARAESWHWDSDFQDENVKDTVETEEVRKWWKSDPNRGGNDENYMFSKV